jgi:hypothetical protein
LRFGICEVPNGKAEKRKYAHALKKRHGTVPHHLKHGGAFFFFIHFDIHGFVSFVD